jgi:hypothetical protein
VAGIAIYANSPQRPLSRSGTHALAVESARDEKHPMLLPVGQKAQFRIKKDKMLLQVEDVDSKEREYNVISITPRHDKWPPRNPAGECKTLPVAHTRIASNGALLNETHPRTVVNRRRKYALYARVYKTAII